MLQFIESGNRLPKPELCSDELYVVYVCVVCDGMTDLCDE